MAASGSSVSNNSNPNNPTHTRPAPTFGHESLPNTTFVQADPSTFRAVVQRLTGKSPTRPSFKLHERRPTARKLEIKLNANDGHQQTLSSTCTTTTPNHHHHHHHHHAVMVSPVSPLEYLQTIMGEEERAIAEKGFYLHPSPISTPRGSDPPELLPLFPLHSPTTTSTSTSHRFHTTTTTHANNHS